MTHPCERCGAATPEEELVVVREDSFWCPGCDHSLQAHVHAILDDAIGTTGLEFDGAPTEEDLADFVAIFQAAPGEDFFGTPAEHIRVHVQSWFTARQS